MGRVKKWYSHCNNLLNRWGLMTLTTVGYDYNPETLLGKILGGCCALSGVILVFNTAAHKIATIFTDNKTVCQNYVPTKLSYSGQISTLVSIICRSLFSPCPFRLLSTVLRPTIRWTLYSLAKYLIIAKCLLGKCLLLIILYQNRMWRNEVNMRKRERTREKVNFKHLMKLIDVSCLKGSCHLGVFLNIEIPMAH